MKKETAEWVAKADGDLQVARREILAATPVFNVVCFLAQQCAEKYLKARLTEHAVAFPRTHDLVVLLHLTGFAMPDLKAEQGGRAHLTTFAVAFRYPGYEALREDADDALQVAEVTRSVVRSALGLAA